MLTTPSTSATMPRGRGMPLLPGMSQPPSTNTLADGDRRRRHDCETRWFSADGCVVFVGTHREVYLGRRQIGSFEDGDDTTRNALLVTLCAEPRQRRNLLAEAFGVTTETIRVMNRRHAEGGLEALVPKKRGGSKPKATKRVRRAIERMYEAGKRPAEVLEVAESRYGIKRSTVYGIYTEWKGAQEAEREREKVLATLSEEQLSLVTATGQSDGRARQSTSTSTSTSTSASANTEKAASAEVKAEAEEVVPMNAVDARPTAVRNAAVVQHAGAWLMLAMVNQLGLHAGIEHLMRGEMAHRVRLAVEAVVAALATGEKCVEGVRRLATPTGTTLLRCGRMPSAPWVRAVLGKFVASGGTMLHGMMAYLYAGAQRARPDDGPAVFYVDNHMRPYTGKQVLRKGWRMQDKRALKGCSDYWIHDVDGRAVKRETAPAHGSLTDWLLSLGRWLQGALGDEHRVLLAFDRAGAFPEQMLQLRSARLEFVTYERRPFPLLNKTAFDRTVKLGEETYGLHESAAKNLRKGRGRVRRIALLTPDGRQVNLLAVGETPAEELATIMRGRWCQENGFRHGNERWGINQLDGRRVTKYAPDTVIPNPARRRLDHAYRLACVREGDARSKLARLNGPNDSRREKLEQDLESALADQQQLQAQRKVQPKHAPLRATELADKLVHHIPGYKTLLDTLRIACINAESDLAGHLAPLTRRPAEAKKILANLLTAPGSIRVGTRTIRVTLSPAASRSEKRAISEFLNRLDEFDFTLPGDSRERRLVFRCAE